MKRLIGLTMVGIMVLSVLSLQSLVLAEVTLKDIAGHEFEYEIKKLAEAGIIKGFPDGTFRPEANITRADTAILLALAKRLPLEKPAVSPFKDVPTIHYAYAHIIAAQKAMIIKGYPDGTFRPGANINRAELAALLGQMKGLAVEATKITTPIALAQDEDEIPKWAVGFVSLGIRPVHQYLTHRAVEGLRVIAPFAPATRAEVAYGVHQVMNPPKTGKVINTAILIEPDTFYTWGGVTGATATMWGAMGLPTVGLDHNRAFYPGALREIPTMENGFWKVVGDKMEMTFRLREGLRWHDGSPVTIDDWAYSFMVFMDKVTPVITRLVEDKIDLTKGEGAYGIKGFDHIGTHEVKIYYKELDWKANMGILGVLIGAIGHSFYPRHIIEPLYKEMKRTGSVDAFIKAEIVARRPLGMGPYKLTEWKHGTHLILEANPDFILGSPLVSKLVFRIMPDTTTLLARAISGKDVDIASVTFDQGLSLTRRRPAHLRICFRDTLLSEHILVRMTSPTLSDIRVRKAFIQAIDRETMTRALFEGQMAVSHNFFPSGHWAYTDKVVKYSYNPTEARRLLDEAGWRMGPDGFRYKDGTRLTIIHETTAGHVIRERVQVVMKAHLKEVGIDLDITKNLPGAIFFPRVVDRKFRDMAQYARGWSLISYGEIDFNVPPKGVSDWKNEEVIEILDRAAFEMSMVKRREMLARMQYIVTEELPVIPLYILTAALASKVDLANITLSGVGDAPLTWNSYNWHWR